VQLAISLLAGLIVLVCAYCVGFNWVATWLNTRRRARGESGHVSLIYLAPQLLLGTAFLLLHTAKVPGGYGLPLLALGAFDIGLWSIIAFAAQQAWGALRRQR